jgi:hypothetical protein
VKTVIILAILCSLWGFPRPSLLASTALFLFLLEIIEYLFWPVEYQASRDTRPELSAIAPVADVAGERNRQTFGVMQPASVLLYK